MLVTCCNTGSVRLGMGVSLRNSHSSIWASVGLKAGLASSCDSLFRSSLVFPGGAREVSGEKPFCLNCVLRSLMEFNHSSTCSSVSGLSFAVFWVWWWYRDLGLKCRKDLAVAVLIR